MTEWSRKMVERLRKRGESQRVRDTKFLETQRLKREIGPSLWQEVTNAIIIEGSALDSEMERDTVTVGKSGSSSELELLANLDDGVRRCHVRFEAETGKLTWKTEKGTGDTIELVVGLDGKMAFHSGMIPQRAESVARQILETLLD